MPLSSDPSGSWELVAEVLDRRSRGLRIPDGMAIAVEGAVVWLVTQALIFDGERKKDVVARFSLQGYRTRFARDPATQTLEVTVEWDDGRMTRLQAPPEVAGQLSTGLVWRTNRR